MLGLIFLVFMRLRGESKSQRLNGTRGLSLSCNLSEKTELL